MNAEDLGIDYERALLSAVLNRCPDLPSLARKIAPDSFDRFDHRWIWEACLAVHSEGLTVSPVTVLDRLVNSGRNVDPLYLHKLMAEPWTEPEWSVQRVHESAVRREVAELGIRCQQLVTDTDKTPQDLISDVQALADRIDSRLAEDPSIMDALAAVIDIAEHGSPSGVMSPWPCLNELIDGFHPGQLVTFAARPGVGKSIALENLATFVARSTKRWVLMVSLEMTSTEITQRTLAHTARVNLTNIRRGQEALTESEWNAINYASGIIADTRVKFADQSVATVADIRASAWAAKQHARRLGESLGAIMVDYVQLVSATWVPGMSRQQYIGTITRGLKQLARQMEIPVFIAAQLRRYDGHDRPPGLSDLKESGNIEEDSDVVVLLDQQWDQDQQTSEWFKTDLIDLIVAKQRNGPEGKRTVKRYGAFARLYDEQIDQRRAG